MTETQVLEGTHQAALAYAARGWRVFPVEPTSAKKPLIRDWPNQATTDSVRIKTWWTKWPDANVGISTDGMVVLDVDNHDGRHAGLSSLQEFGELPFTPTATTPSGGMHLYFAGDGPSRRGIKPGLDTRGRKGFVVAPPSRDERGAYLWRKGVAPHEVEVASVPGWLAELMAATPPPQRSQRGHTRHRPAVPEGPIREGLRRATLVPLARRLRHYGVTFDDILASLSAVNEARCDPSLPQEEIDRIARWASKQPSFSEEYATLERAWVRPRSGGITGVTDFKVIKAFLEVSRLTQSTEVSVSTRRLASLARVERKTVSNSMKRLVAGGHVVREGVDLPGRAMRYRLAVPQGAEGGRVDVGTAEEFMLRVAFGVRYNALLVLRELLADDAVTTKELASAVHMRVPTVRDNLRWLRDHGVIVETESGWDVTGYWRLAMDPETDTDTRFALIGFFAHNMGTLKSWWRRQTRMDDEVTRYDQRFRQKYGIDRLTGEVLEGAAV